MTQPIAAAATKALTAEAAMSRGAIAKLHSLVASNSLVCRSFMMARTSVADCSDVSGARLSPDLAVDLDGRRKPAVMNRSELFLRYRLSRSASA